MGSADLLTLAAVVALWWWALAPRRHQVDEEDEL
jgi:hypothetical protein